jgi:hypothetical protein
LRVWDSGPFLRPVHLWKACGIENLYLQFLPAIAAQFLFGTYFFSLNG